MRQKEKLETVREERDRGRTANRADRERCKKWRRELHRCKTEVWREEIMVRLPPFLPAKPLQAEHTECQPVRRRE